MWYKIKQWFSNLFNKTDYEAMYLEQLKLAEHWEFKYNKLYRKLNEIVKENI